MKKISIRFTVWVSLPLLFAFGLTIFVITSFLNTQIMEEKHKVVKEQLELANSLLSSQVGIVRSLHGSLCLDENLKKLMYQQHDEGVTSSLCQSLSDICGVYRSRNTSLFRMIFPVNLDGIVLSNIYTQDTLYGFTNGDSSFQCFTQSLAYGGFYKGDKDKNEGTLMYYGNYYDMNNYNKLGYIVINIRLNYFFAELPKVLGPSFSQIFVLDNNQNSIYEFSTDLPASILPRDVLSVAGRLDNRLVLNGHTFLAYRRIVDAYPNWSIVGLIDYEDMIRQIRKTSFLVAGIFACTACLLFTICFIVARKITQPILRINKAMLQISEGIWPEPVESHTADEMHSLITGFNNMTESVKRLTESRIADQEEKRRIETSMLQGRLDLLQSQINPHFIHNTLNTMKYMALKEGNKELYETIVSFNNLLRSSINIDSRFASVSEELGYLESYIYIQKRRYGEEQVIFQVYSDPEAANALLPKLILQPLVENALFHGILTTRRAGRIGIVVMVENSTLVVSISDNGQGIDSEVLEKLLDGTYRNTRGYNRIGLRNVMDRIRLYYPDNSEFHISSQPGYGTLILFKIPYI